MPMLLNGLQYTFFKSGPVSSNGVEACAFTVPEDGGGDPIIKIYCVPTTTYRDPDVKGVPDVDGVTSLVGEVDHVRVGDLVDAVVNASAGVDLIAKV